MNGEDGLVLNERVRELLDRYEKLIGHKVESESGADSLWARIFQVYGSHINGGSGYLPGAWERWTDEHFAFVHHILNQVETNPLLKVLHEG